MAHDYIRTHMGYKFKFSNISQNTIDIKDIAWALSHTCRYGGHPLKFYSVAEHCVHVSNSCPTYKFEGLMHDAAEAFIGDIVSPLKRLLPEFIKIEQQLELAISQRFGLRYPWPAEVHEYDLRLLANEMPVLFGNSQDVQHEPVIVLVISCLSPEAAYELFISKYNELKSGPIVKINYGELKEADIAKA